MGVGPFSPTSRKPGGSADLLQHSETKKEAREIVRLLERQYDRPTSPLVPIDQDGHDDFRLTRPLGRTKQQRTLAHGLAARNVAIGR